jgi:hypothetical protein
MTRCLVYGRATRIGFVVRSRFHTAMPAATRATPITRWNRHRGVRHAQEPEVVDTSAATHWPATIRATAYAAPIFGKTNVRLAMMTKPKSPPT